MEGKWARVIERVGRVMSVNGPVNYYLRKGLFSVALQWAGPSSRAALAHEAGLGLTD